MPPSPSSTRKKPPSSYANTGPWIYLALSGPMDGPAKLLGYTFRVALSSATQVATNQMTSC